MLKNKKLTKNKNTRLAWMLLAVVVGLVGGTFASAPLYRLFCQVTGFGGTTQVADKKSEQAIAVAMSDAELKQRVEHFHNLDMFFDATINPETPIKVNIRTPKLSVKLADSHRVIYRVTNISDQAITITSSYNATPPKYGYYISKVECFCFTEQHLKPRESKDFSLVFFISPLITTAEGADKIRELTVGYHFYLVGGKEDNGKHNNEKHDG